MNSNIAPTKRWQRRSCQICKNYRFKDKMNSVECVCIFDPKLRDVQTCINCVLARENSILVKKR